MRAPVFNFKGETVGEVDLPEGIFGVRWNSDLIHQALIVQQANQRKPIAHAKNRGEVRGGGKKPWRQKGTGRARHGSIRSPIWKGGGVTHGPRNDRRFDKKINKKMLKAALHSVLSRKFKDQELRIVDSLVLRSFKTKELAGALSGFFSKTFNNMKVSALLVPALGNKEIFRASRNIPKIRAIGAKSINVEDLLKHKAVLIDKSAIQEIK